MSSKRSSRKSTRKSNMTDDIPDTVVPQSRETVNEEEEVVTESSSSTTAVTTTVASETTEAAKATKLKKKPLKKRAYLTACGKNFRKGANGAKVSKNVVVFLSQHMNRVQDGVTKSAISSAMKNRRLTISADDIYNGFRIYCGNTPMMNKCIEKAKSAIAAEKLKAQETKKNKVSSTATVASA